eukprot:3845759-Amphidinium_carterae.1
MLVIFVVSTVYVQAALIIKNGTAFSCFSSNNNNDNDNNNSVRRVGHPLHGNVLYDMKGHLHML